MVVNLAPKGTDKLKVCLTPQVLRDLLRVQEYNHADYLAARADVARLMEAVRQTGDQVDVEEARDKYAHKALNYIENPDQLRNSKHSAAYWIGWLVELSTYY